MNPAHLLSSVDLVHKLWCLILFLKLINGRCALGYNFFNRWFVDRLMIFRFAKRVTMPETEVINTKGPLSFLNYSETDLFCSDGIEDIYEQRRGGYETWLLIAPGSFRVFPDVRPEHILKAQARFVFQTLQWIASQAQPFLYCSHL